ncbi:NAD-dependent epimerase/dehydratase family protein [Thiomicrorhabdus sp. ZW0627]|uniref:NAD-dependent epimerase/dehydratase family protein n=1 Tax=Thiomicrorhabdus sp. ZW0627 TaxID=3039774 RepID=UPI002437221F|nr:NAD-dependent epimerase/dehydratase family protein [Thiomicrorhabdus sp. ZW0627]MDG6774887.1 NAD-dependent epimerase/dehydratase family protein [Thiomicrorhabdus sp. ZW0627]
MANILIVGCGGIGSELALTLIEQGHTVYGLRRHTDNLPDGIIPIEADITLSLSEFIPENLDYVFYSASAGKHKDMAYYQAYVLGVKHTLKALSDQNIKRIFFISSSSVFGQSEGEKVTEESPTSGNNFSTKRLLEGEELISNANFPSTIVRFGGIYGPGRTHLIDLIQQGKAHCMEDVYSNRIHSADCVGILAHLLNLNEQDPKLVDSLYIGVDDQPTLSCEVYEWLAEQLSVGHIEHIEPTENSRLMRSNKRLSNAKIRSSGYDFKYPDYQAGYGELI